MGLFDDFQARLMPGMQVPSAGGAPPPPPPAAADFRSRLMGAGLPGSMPDVSMPSGSTLGGFANKLLAVSANPLAADYEAAKAGLGYAKEHPFAARLGESMPVIGSVLQADRLSNAAADAVGGTSWGAAHPSAVSAMRVFPGSGGAPPGVAPQAGAPETTLMPGVAGTPSLPAVASLAEQAKLRPQGVGGAYGGGGGGNPMGGLAGAVARDNAEMLATYGTQGDQTTEKGRLEAKALADKANVDSMMADRANREAQIRQEEDAIHYAKLDDWQQKSAAKVDQLGAMQVDPKRLFANADAADRFQLMLGGAIGGVLVGTGAQSSNAFIDGVNKQIAQDISAQEKAIDVKDRELGHRNTMLGQFEKIHGDRALAKKQAEDTMLGATRQYMQAQADSENLPASARNNAALAVTQIDRERVGLKSQIDKQALAAAQAQAAAAAGARAAAEKRAWDRSIQVAELGLKRDELDIKAADAGGAGGKVAREDARHISTQLVDKGIPQAMTAATMALDATTASPRGRLERFARTVAPEASSSFLSSESNLREQAYKNFTNAAMKVQMGNVTAGEELRANIQFAADPRNTDEQRKGAVKNAIRMMQSAEADIRGGASEAGQAQFDRQRAAAHTSGPQAGSGASSFQPVKP